MNRNILNFYSKLIDDGAATERDIYDALYSGIRNEDRALVEKSLSMLPHQDEWNNEDYPYPTDFAVDEMASNDIVALITDKGYSFDCYPSRLSLFNFTPREMISFYIMNYPERKTPYEEISVHIAYYLYVYRNRYSIYRIPFKIDCDNEYKPHFISYIDSWCCDFINAVCKETDKNMKDEIIWNFFQKSVRDAGLKNLFIKTRELVEEDMLHRNITLELESAICEGNGLAFNYLLPLADIDSLSFSYYPRKNLKVLEKIQSLGQLIPGTETGFKAFSGYIEFGEIDHETLCNIIQSSCNRGFGCIGSRSDSKRQQRKQCSSPIGSGKKAG